MCALKINTNIQSGSIIKLPNTSRTLPLREQCANKMSEQFQTMLLSVQEPFISIKDYKNYISKIIGSKRLGLNITQLSSNEINASITPEIKLYRYKNQPEQYFSDYIGYKMEVKHKKNKIRCSKATLVHETRHLFDMLCNPKYKMARHYKNLDDKSVINKFIDIKNFIESPCNYNPKRVMGLKVPTFEKELRAKIEGLSNTEIVDILQICRYHLKSEQNAYSDAEKFNLKSYPKTLKTFVTIMQMHFDTKRNFQFAEKERVIKKLIKEYIANERSKIKLS